MPIEFRCTGCSKLLRVPDESAGRKAQCPSCQAVLEIPVAAERVAEVASASPFAPSTTATESGNPFQSPLAESSEWSTHGGAFAPYHPDQLASRGMRFLGFIVDSLIPAVAVVPMLIGMFVFIGLGASEYWMFGLVAFGVLISLAIAVFQWYLISTTGQSIAKRLLGMRIIRVENSELPGFVNGVLLRNWIPGLIGAVPYVGFFFTIADPLFIFGAERRCIHDHIAGTVVVNA